MEALIADIIALHRAQVSPENIADQLGVTLREVTTILDASDIIKKPRISETKINNIIEDYQKFLPLYEISQQHEVAVGTIYSILNARGVARRGPTSRLTNSQYEKALSLYYAGYKAYQIEKDTGVASSLLYRYIHELELPTWREDKKASDKYYEFLKDAGTSFIGASS